MQIRDGRRKSLHERQIQWIQVAYSAGSSGFLIGVIISWIFAGCYHVDDL